MGRTWTKRKVLHQIELPIKIEKQQLIKKITKLSEEELLEMYNEIYKILNINALEKMSKKYEERKKDTANIGQYPLIYILKENIKIIITKFLKNIF